MHDGLHSGGAGRDLAALAWLVGAGIDTLVEDTPRSWLEVSASSPAGDGHPGESRDSTTVTRSPAASVSGPGIRQDDQHAARAAAAGSLAALAASIATLSDMPALFADGNPASGVMIVGEMPTAQDAAMQRLFSGQTGELLDRMLASIGRDRGSSYLAAAHYWPMPGGRTPEPRETAATAPLIRRHVALARPRAVLVLGTTATAALLGTTAGLGKLRGRWQQFDLNGVAVPVLPSFSPGYLLRHPAHKALAWVDLQAFAAKVAQ